MVLSNEKMCTEKCHNEDVYSLLWVVDKVWRGKFLAVIFLCRQ